MSKKLEFKAWGKKLKKYIGEDFLGQCYINMDGKPVWFAHNGFTYVEHLVVIEQYTGFKDKNMVKIFENDIIDKKYRVRVIRHHGCWCVTSKYVEVQSLYKWLIKRIKAGVPSEIIGNLNQDASLLK